MSEYIDDETMVMLFKKLGCELAGLNEKDPVNSINYAINAICSVLSVFCHYKGATGLTIMSPETSQEIMDAQATNVQCKNTEYIM